MPLETRRGVYVIEAIWLFCVIAGILAWTRYDVRQYSAFKEIQDSRHRQASFLRWTAQGFAVLTGLSVLTLIVLGRIDSPFELPNEFRSVSAALQKGGDPQSSDGALGFAIGLGIGLVALGIAQIIRIRKMLKPVTPDIEPMLPRNGREMLAIIPLCVNAGFSEELLFRLALPLLIFDVTGSVAAAFVVANIMFGIAHAYQGWKGVVATALVGCLLTLIYLSSGSLLRVMILHAAIDVVALIIRPALAKAFARKAAKPASELS